jgi:putative tryptophan/tyrosine transport system substrate-binding protein
MTASPAPPHQNLATLDPSSPDWREVKIPRRGLFLLLAGAIGAPALAPVAARGQTSGAPSGQPSRGAASVPATPTNPSVPLVGFLHPGSAGGYSKLLDAFADGLKTAGYVDGDNIAVGYQWAGDDPGRLPAMAAELARSNVALLVALGHDATFAAKAATSTIPIVFVIGENPVALGLVANLARPGGNMTGVDADTSQLTAKRLDILRGLAPGAAHVGVLVNPADAASSQATIASAQQAASFMSMQIRVLIAGTADDIDAAFDTIKNERLDGLLVDSTPFFSARLVQLVNLAASYAVPTVYGGRQFPEAGGLISFGPSLADAYRQAGTYTGRILKGESPADIPIARPEKFELVINVKVAKRLGIAVPPDLLAQAVEVIE